MTFSPTVERWALARILRERREAAGLDSTKVSRSLGWNPSKLSYIESGQFRLIDELDVLRLIEHYGADNDEQACMREIAKRSRFRGWWYEYRDVFEGPLPDLEWGAGIIRAYEITLIPGLLQTPSYARTVFEAGRVLAKHEVQRRVDARMRRQEILRREDPPELWVVLDETAVRKTVGSPEIMHEQIEQLIEIAEWPNVNIQILPDTLGAHAGMLGPFTILWVPAHGGSAVVYRETPIGTPHHSDKADEAERYRLKYGELVAQAKSPTDSVKYLHENLVRFN